MSGVSDLIEHFIMEMFDDDQTVEIKRNELAQYMGCAPSQINYVLTTRFTTERGYVISSRRGGGGCITIARVDVDGNDMLEYINNTIGSEISVSKAAMLLKNLCERGDITEREAQVMLAAMGDSPFIKPTLRDAHRAGLMKAMLTALLR